MLSANFSYSITVDRIVAVFEDRAITEQFVNSVNNVFFSGKDTNSALNFIIDSFVILGAAERFGVFANDAEVDSFIDKIYPENREEFERYIEENGMSLEEYKDFIKSKIVGDKIVMKISGIHMVTDDELRKFWVDNKHQFEERKVFHIFIPSEHKEILRDIVQRIERGVGVENPKRFAENYSFSKSIDLGWVKRGELRKEFEKVIFSLKKGEFSSPVSYPPGYFIFFVEDIRLGDFRSSKTDIKNTYIKKKYGEVLKEWVEGQKQHFYIMIQDQ